MTIHKNIDPKTAWLLAEADINRPIYQLWTAERERNAKLVEAIDDCLIMLNGCAMRAEHEDATQLRKFTARLRKELWS